MCGVFATSLWEFCNILFGIDVVKGHPEIYFKIDSNSNIISQW